MKTLTEFATPTLKNAAKIRQELTAAGKTAEELPAALGEALKLEGDKLTFLINALDTVGEKLGDLKRVLVASLAEGEKPVGKGEMKGEHFYVTEYYAPVGSAPSGKFGGKSDDRGGRGDRDKNKRGGGGKGGRGERGGPGGDRGPRGERSAGGPGGGPGGAPRGDRPRGPRPASGPVGNPSGGPIVVKPLNRPASPVPAQATPAPDAPKPVESNGES